MPILWRLLLKDYVVTLLLSVGSFVAILLTSRLEEIAHFASFGADITLLLWFTLLQIPYILPLAIPVGSLIAGYLLTKKLSIHHELTAMRSAGFSLREILAPLIALSLLLSALNFFIVSEMATASHKQAGELKQKLRSVNPLLILHNKHLMKTKGVYLDVLGRSKMGQYAEEVVMALPNKSHQTLDLLVAQELTFKDDRFNAKGLGFLSTLKTSETASYPSLLLESIERGGSGMNDFQFLFQSKPLSLSADHHNMAYLMLRKAALSQKNEKTQPIFSEIARRLSLGLTPFCFTLLGIACGLQTGRTKSLKSWVAPLLIIVLFVSCFFAGQAFQSRAIAPYLFLVPEFLMTAYSLHLLLAFSRGRES